MIFFFLSSLKIVFIFLRKIAFLRFLNRLKEKVGELSDESQMWFLRIASDLTVQSKMPDDEMTECSFFMPPFSEKLIARFCRHLDL